MRQAKDEAEIKKLTLAGVKNAYNDLAKDYNKLIEQEVVLCPKCNKFKARGNFYLNKDYDSEFFPICKDCLMKMSTDYDKKTDKYKDNKEKAKHTLMLMDRPYIEEVYDNAVADVTNAVNEKNRSTAWAQYITMINPLPNWRGFHFKDSEYKDNSEYDDEAEIKENKAIIKKAKKRFGPGYSPEDYVFLWNEYQDWVARYTCETKAQESIFERLAFKKWEIMKATKNGQPTKDLDKTYTDLLGTANIQPKQNVSNSVNDSLTFGQLIDKWEEEQPIPEPTEEFKDVDKIGLLIDVFFKGHLSKMMGLKNGFSRTYENFMKKYTVTKPEYDEDTDSEILFDQIFGKQGDE